MGEFAGESRTGFASSEVRFGVGGGSHAPAPCHILRDVPSIGHTPHRRIDFVEGASHMRLDPANPCSVLVIEHRQQFVGVEQQVGKPIENALVDRHSRDYGMIAVSLDRVVALHCA